MNHTKVITISIHAIGALVPMVLWSSGIHNLPLTQWLYNTINGDHIEDFLFNYFFIYGTFSWIVLFIERIQKRYRFSESSNWLKKIVLFWFLFYIIRFVFQVIISPPSNPSEDELGNHIEKFFLVTWDHTFLIFYFTPLAFMTQKKNSILNEILLIYSSIIISFLFLHHFYSVINYK